MLVPFRNRVNCFSYKLNRGPLSFTPDQGGASLIRCDNASRKVHAPERRLNFRKRGIASFPSLPRDYFGQQEIEVFHAHI